MQALTTEVNSEQKVRYVPEADHLNECPDTHMPPMLDYLYISTILEI